MSFTDDDLKRLKAFTERHALQPEYTVHTANGVMEALLARLEAAEKVIAESLDHNGKAHIGFDAWHEAYKAWRKVAGK